MPSAVDHHVAASPFRPALQKVPVDPRVKVNSIIAAEGDGPIEQGNDGVVDYSSAHIEPVESELVVKWNHSLQGAPTPSRRSAVFSGYTRVQRRAGSRRRPDDSVRVRSWRKQAYEKLRRGDTHASTA
jgi:hypothetical protein